MSDIETPHIRKDNRTLVIKPIDPAKAGKSLFKVEQINAVMNPTNCLWRFKYDSGVLPQQLKKQYTAFKFLLKDAEEYFSKRGMKVVEVLD